MPEERFLTIQLHELLMYLGQRGVATILIGAHQGLIGSQMNTPVDASYLADAVILLRYFEAKGEVRQAISVMKKRGSKHERTIREFRLDGGRISIGEALTRFPRHPDRCARVRRPRPASWGTTNSRERERRRRPVTAVCSSSCRPARTHRSRRTLLSSNGIRLEVCPTFDGAGAGAETGRGRHPPSRRSGVARAQHGTCAKSSRSNRRGPIFPCSS